MSPLAACVDEVLGDYKRPVAFTVADELPLTPLGKIDRREIIEQDALDSV